MNRTIFVYPTGGKGTGTRNPYIDNMKAAFSNQYKVLQPKFGKMPRMLVFLLNSFKADIYVLNWIEDSAAARGGFVGGMFSMLGLWIVCLRRVKMVWIFHNIHPHGGETCWSKAFRRFLFKHCSFIVAHSKEAADYARNNAYCPVYFKNHPMKKKHIEKWEGEVRDCDFFIWSDILSYKGVPEFVENPLWKQSEKTLFIVGRSENDVIRERIINSINKNIVYEERFPSFEEVAAQCVNAKYVLFPYIGDSISSSGVLMDTLMMGGIPVGPNRGAFADLASCGCCITYDAIDEVFLLPVGENNRIRLDPNDVKKFIMENTWEGFSEWFYNKTI